MTASPPQVRRAGIDQQGLRRRLTLLLAGLIAGAVLAVGFAAIAAFDRAVAPELRNRVELIGSIVRFEVQRVLELGIPLDAVAGLDQYLADTLADFDEIDRIAVLDASGRALASADRPDAEPGPATAALGLIAAGDDGRTLLPILRGNRIVGEIAIDVSPVFVQTRLRDVFLDVGVLMLIAAVIAGELALVVVVASIGKPLDRVRTLLSQQTAGDFRHTIRAVGLLGLRRTAARLNDHAADLGARVQALPQAARASFSGRIAGAEGPVRLRFSDFNDIRIALFLFSAGTEVSLSFLPLFAERAARPDWLPADFAAAAPIVAYLAGIAAVTPFAGRWVRKVGARWMFTIAVPAAALALVGIGFAKGVVRSRSGTG